MKIFDLHCDTILACEVGQQQLLENRFHIDLKKMKAGEAYAQCFAIFLDKHVCDKMKKTPYERYQEVYSYFCQQMNQYRDLIARAQTVEEMQDLYLDHKISAILTVEGGEVLEGRIERLQDLYQDGVRLLTLTWNYENEIGFPHSIGGGLKPFGFEVVEQMNDLGMLIDVSHLSDEGVKDILSITKKPIIASHSCARSLCNHTRNLTDELLTRIGDQGGVVGLNYFKKFLDPMGRESTLEMIRDHAKHIVRYAGMDALALGSDFDGIDGTLEWKDYSGMQMIVDTLHKDFSESVLEKICYRNAERIFASQY